MEPRIVQQTVRAIYENGVLRPLSPLRGVSEHSEVRLVVRDSSLSPHQTADDSSVLPKEDMEAMVRALEEAFERSSKGGSESPGLAQPSKNASMLRFVASLADLEQLRPGWNTYGAAPPSVLALSRALRILTTLHAVDYLPHRVLPLADGGVALTFGNGSLYASVECFNDGEITAGISDRAAFHEAWDVDLESVATAVERIRAFLDD